MASTDWTSAIATGTGAFAIVANGTAPSAPNVMQISSTGTGGVMFQNITGGTFKNSRISGWANQLDEPATAEFFLCLRSLNATAFIAAPSTYLAARISPNGTTQVFINVIAVVNGVVTIIVNSNVATQNGTPVATWQQYQFSAFNSGTDILLRLSMWNGAAFVPISDCAAPIATFPTLDAAGSARFGALMTGGGQGPVLIDDVSYYSLT